MMRCALMFLAFSLTAFSAADAQTMRLVFSSDDFVVTPVFNDVVQFTFDIEIDAPLAPGVYTNPDIISVLYRVSGDLMNTPSNFPAFALERDITGDEFYAQGSSLVFVVLAGAVLDDGVQIAELAGSGVVFTFNGKEVGNGRFHPALLELNADGTGMIQNSDNIITEDPFQQVDFGEEYITDLAFDAGNLTLLTAVAAEPDPPVRRSGGGAISPQLLFLLLLLTLGARRLRADLNPFIP
ncbi:MAG: hypothetical protein QNK34_05115 [Woeseiaceae bacterium]|nr:hypothetical protein [Woeseiaceae bacterium]